VVDPRSSDNVLDADERLGIVDNREGKALSDSDVLAFLSCQEGARESVATLIRKIEEGLGIRLSDPEKSAVLDEAATLLSARTAEVVGAKAPEYSRIALLRILQQKNIASEIWAQILACLRGESGALRLSPKVAIPR
jgi:hypothetical protein